MNNNNQFKSQDVKNINVANSLDCMLSENLELFKRALFDAMDLKIRKVEEETKDIELPPPSKRHKTLMNRLFRERACGAFLPFPEEDTI